MKNLPKTRRTLRPLPLLQPLSPVHPRPPEPTASEPLPQLRFSPLAWLKLQFLCHAGQTEVGGFGISAAEDALYVERVETVMQGVTATSVEFSDSAVAEHFDRWADRQVFAARCGRIWIHTHPGDCPNPSHVDEQTFAHVFGPCDWALMFILSRTGRTYARLRYGKESNDSLLLPVGVDWSHWPACLDGEAEDLTDLCRLWRHEYESNVYDLSHMGRWHDLDPEEIIEFDMTVQQEECFHDAGGAVWPWHDAPTLVTQGGSHEEW